MSAAETTTPRHHPGWREVRATVLAGPDVLKAYQELAPRFAVVRQLIAHREQHGWRQRELADRAEMKRPQQARLETGQVEPKLNTLERLAKAMGVQALRELTANGSSSKQHKSEQP
jgi:ribosome-binding protein aMBF1 (putative translation factor)